MANEDRIVIIGGHGKIALLAAAKLSGSGYRVDSLIRNPDHASDVEQAGAHPVLLDIEHAGPQDLADVFAGAAGIVFSAGAGGGNPDRTRAVDRDGAVHAMEAAEKAGVRRFVMVSYSRALRDADQLDPTDAFHPYAAAKQEADARLRGTSLDWTILGPARLTLDPSRGTIRLLDEDGRPVGEDVPDDQMQTARETVADVIQYVISQHAAIGRTVNFVEGPTPIAEAIG